jgi:uncharacterized SAM-binding protein YcdF (DUF218 family)
VAERVVAVFGYSRRSARELHPICAERITYAQEIAEGTDAVILSGSNEAEIMRAAWGDARAELLLDLEARHTVTNARNAVRAAKELGAEELVVVTSRWHAPRTSVFLRSLAPDGLRVSVEGAPGRRHAQPVAREVLCFLLLPLQLAWARLAR